MTSIPMEATAQPRLALPSLAWLMLGVLAALMLPSVTMMWDPLVRHDDYPALLGVPELFYDKTLSEGRWLNYAWHLRGVITPAWLNFLAYNALFALYLAVMADMAMGPRGGAWRKLFVAAIAGLAVPQLVISPWFNTLIPGMAVVALYAVLSANLGNRASRALLPIFVPVALMAYTTYPFMLLALCLLRQDARRSWADLAGLLGLFLVSFAIGMLAIYGLNKVEHGVFGIVMADWRNPNPLDGLPALYENLSVVWAYLHAITINASFSHAELFLAQAALFCAGVWMVARRDPFRAIYPLAGLVLGLSMLLAQGLRTGIELPMRTSGFAWACYAVFVGWLSLELRDAGRARLGRNLLFVVAALYVAMAGIERHLTNAWQTYSHALAAEIGTGPEPLLITGTSRSLPPARKSQLQGPLAVIFRLEHLTGRAVYLCEAEPEPCAALPAKLLEGLDDPAPGQLHAITRREDAVVVSFQSEPIMDQRVDTSLSDMPRPIAGG